MINISSDNADLNQSSILIEVEKLEESFGRIARTVEKIHGPYLERVEVDCGDISDALSMIRGALVAAIDGRPRPFDMSHVEFGPDYKDWEKFPEATRKGMIERRKHLAFFAECDAGGYREKASIGKECFDLKDLKRLRSWIDDAIKYHEQFPSTGDD